MVLVASSGRHATLRYRCCTHLLSGEKASTRLVYTHAVPTNTTLVHMHDTDLSVRRHMEGQLTQLVSPVAEQDETHFAVISLQFLHAFSAALGSGIMVFFRQNVKRRFALL